jgi:hypothetical protein
MSDVALDMRTARAGLRIWDGVSWVLAIPVAAWLRYEGDLSGVALAPISQFAVSVRLLQTRVVIGDGGVNPGFPGPSIVPITSAQRPTPPPSGRGDATPAADHAERA